MKQQWPVILEDAMLTLSLKAGQQTSSTADAVKARGSTYVTSKIDTLRRGSN